MRLRRVGPLFRTLYTYVSSFQQDFNDLAESCMRSLWTHLLCLLLWLLFAISLRLRLDDRAIGAHTKAMMERQMPPCSRPQRDPACACAV